MNFSREEDGVAEDILVWWMRELCGEVLASVCRIFKGVVDEVFEEVELFDVASFRMERKKCVPEGG